MLTITDPWSTPNGGWHCTNEEDGHFLRLGSMESLFRAWEAHRKAKGQSFFTREQLVDKFCRQLPADCPTCGQAAVNPYEWPDLAEWRTYENKPISEWGPAGWRAIHKRQLSTDPHDNERWLQTFIASIPCNLMPRQCRHHFEAFVKANPPDYSSQPNFFAWTVKAHNEANQRTGKLQMSLEDAAKLYA